MYALDEPRALFYLILLLFHVQVSCSGRLRSRRAVSKISVKSEATQDLCTFTDRETAYAVLDPNTVETDL